MSRRREAGLHRGVGFTGMVGVLFGNTAAALFLVLGITAREALGLTPLVFVLAGAVFFLILLPFLEGIAMLPQSGGASGFARRAFNDLVSFLTAWALTLDYLIVIAMTAFFTSHYVGAISGLEGVSDSPYDTLMAVTLIVCVAAVNIRGVAVSNLISVVVSQVALVAELVLVLLGLVLVFDLDVLTHSVELGGSHVLSGVAYALPIAMMAFVGLDTIANLSGELRDPERLIARPMIWSGLTSVVLLVITSMVALSAMPVTGTGARASTPLGLTDEHGGFIDRPLVGVVDNLPLATGLEHALHLMIAVLAASMLFLLANTSMNGLSRLVYAMSINRQVPGLLGRINRSNGVPVYAVIIYAAISIGLLLLTETLRESAIVLAQLYAFGSLFSLIMALAALLWLRITEPDLPRPIRAGLNVTIRGKQVSIVMVAGLLAAFAVWVLVLAMHDSARVLGSIWMVSGFVMYATYRFTHGQGLRIPAAPMELPHVQISARHYEKVLLAMRPEKSKLWGSGDAEAAALAHRLLDDPNGKVSAMLVHELPLTVELTADMGVDEQITTRRLSLLRAVTDKLGVRLSSTIMRARAAGRAICQEADRQQADAVVLATAMKNRSGDLVFGKTVTYVLRHARCDVIILCFPAETLRKVDRKMENREQKDLPQDTPSSKVPSI